MFPRQLLYLESWALPRNTFLLCFTSLPELQRLGKSTGVSLSTGRRTTSLVVVKEAMTEKIRLCLSAHRPVRESKPWAHLPKQPYIWFFLLMHNVTLNTISCADHSGEVGWLGGGGHTFRGVTCFSRTVQFSSSSLTHTIAGCRTLLGSRMSTWKRENKLNSGFSRINILIHLYT